MVFKCYLIVILILLFFFSTELYPEWHSIAPEGVEEDLYGISFADSRNGVVVGCNSDGSVILITDDGGNTWNRINLPNTMLFEADMPSPSEITLAGFQNECLCGILYRTTDGGDTWSTIFFTEEDKMFTFGLYTYKELDSNTYITAGYNGKIYKSINGGSKWRQMKTGTVDQVFKYIDFPDTNIGYAISGDSYFDISSIYKSTDRGDTWSRLKNFKDSISIGGINFRDSFNGFLYGSSGNRESIMKTTDGGESWNEIFNGKEGQEINNGLFIDNKNGIALKQDGGVVITTDGGQSWKEEKTGSKAMLFNINVVTESQVNTIYVTGSRGTLLKNEMPTSVFDPEYTRNIENIYINDNILLIQLNGMAGPKNLMLYELSGKELLKNTFHNEDIISFSLSEFPSGSYYFRLLHGSKTIKSGLLIK